MKRKKYVKPVLEVVIVNVEGSISAVSASFTVGGAEAIPEVEDWEEVSDTEDVIF